MGTTTFDYGPQSGLLTAITDPLTGGATTTYEYNSRLQHEHRTDPNGLVHTLSYDPAGHLTGHEVERSGDNKANFEVVFDLGRFTSLDPLTEDPSSLNRYVLRIG